MWRFAWQNLITRPTRTLLAVVGLTIPIIAILGLFSLTHGIRTLMGNTLAKMNGLMVMRANSPAPVFSDLPEGLAEDLRKIPGTRIVAPEVWKICPPSKDATRWRATAKDLFTKRGAERFSSLVESIMIEGQQLPEHLHLVSGVYEQGILPPEKGGGRFLELADVGKPNVLISTKIARDYPGSDGKPKKAGDSIRIGGKPFQVIGIYETGSFLIDETIVMEITTARQLLGVDKSSVSVFYIEPQPLTDLSVLTERITQSAVENVQVRSMSSFNIEVGDIMGKLDMLLLMAVGLALPGRRRGNRQYDATMSAMERFVEFGVMRANGWTRRNILGLVTAESALLGLLSGGAGSSVVAFAGVTILNSYLTRFELRLELTPELVAESNVTAIVIATIGGPLPRLAHPSPDPHGRNPQRGLMKPADSSPRHHPEEPCMIRVSDVRKTFRSGEEDVQALRGVSFEVPRGAFSFIVGPSGSGKSTLLYLLGALDNPTSGTIAIDGQTVTGMNEVQQDLFRRRKLGFIFQQFNLIHNLTAVGNGFCPFIPVGVAPPLNAKAEDLLRQVGLGHRLSHKPSKLSGGQQQRVAIARALIKDPVVILGDEPTGNLDHKGGDEIFALLREQQEKRGCTLVVVTHDRRFIRPSDQVLEIQDGLISP